MTEIFKTRLDDGQVINCQTLSELSQYQLISLANQLYRCNNEKDALLVMAYQHKRFYENTPPPLKVA
jgi:hypothetical protein